MHAVRKRGFCSQGRDLPRPVFHCPPCSPTSFVRMHCEQHHLIPGQGGGQCGAGAPRERAIS